MREEGEGGREGRGLGSRLSRLDDSFVFRGAGLLVFEGR